MLFAGGKSEGFSFADADLGWQASFVHSTRHFIAALRSGTQPRLTGEEGRDILRFALAAQISADLGRAVRVDEVDAAQAKRVRRSA